MAARDPAPLPGGLALFATGIAGLGLLGWMATGTGTWAYTEDGTGLPFFATGLGALGLLGWRRKKKAAA